MLRALVGIGLLQVVTMLLQLVRTKALALMLGPSQVGVMAVIDKLLAVIVQTASLSLPFAAIRFLPAEWANGAAPYALRFRQMRRLLFVLSGVALACALGVHWVAPDVWGAELQNYRAVVLAAACTIPVLAFAPFLQNAVAGRLAERRAMHFSMAHAAIGAAAVLGVTFAGLTGYYALYAIGGLLLVIPVAVMLGRPAAAETLPSESLVPPAPIWRFGVTMLLVAFASPYAALVVHYSVLQQLGASAAGWMQAAIGIGLAVRAVLGSAHAVFLTPNVNRGGSPESRMAWANAFQENFCLLSLIAVPPLLLLPELAVRVLYAADFAPGATFVALFVAGEVLLLMAGTYQALVVSLDHLRFHVVQNLSAQAIVILAATLLIPRFGLVGAAIATLGAPLVLVTSTLVFLHRRHGLRMTPRARQLGIMLALTLGIAGAAGSVASASAPQGIAIRLAAQLLAAMLVFSNLSLSERARLRQVILRRSA